MAEDILYSVTTPKTIMEMSWEEVEELLKKTDAALVGVASIEEHGPHLPLGTDTFFCAEILKVAKKVLMAEGLDVLIGPTVEYGVCMGAMSYPGSISVRPETLKNLLVDIGEALYHHGFKNIAFVMGHDENLPAMAMAAQELVFAHKDIKALSLNIMGAMKSSEGASLKPKKRDGHAGAGEVSRILVTQPNLVQLNRARPDPDIDAPPRREITGAGAPLFGGGDYNPWIELNMYHRSRHPGQTGDPHLGDAEIGRKAYEAMGNWVADVIKRDFWNK